MTLNTASLVSLPVVPAQAPDPTDIQQACGDDPSFVCRRVLEWTDSTGWAEAADKLVATPLTILLIVLLAYVAHLIVRRAIRRLTDKIADPDAQQRMQKLKKRAPTAIVDTGTVSLRPAARAQTLALVL